MDSRKRKPLAQVAAAMQKSCYPYGIIIIKDAESLLSKLYDFYRAVQYNKIKSQPITSSWLLSTFYETYFIFRFCVYNFSKIPQPCNIKTNQELAITKVVPVKNIITLRHNTIIISHKYLESM